VGSLKDGTLKKSRRGENLHGREKQAANS